MVAVVRGWASSLPDHHIYWHERPVQSGGPLRVTTGGRRRTTRIVCTRRAGRILTGPHVRCGGAGRGGAVMWGPRSMSRAWQPGQVFDLRLCVAVPIRGVCGTAVVTAWRWAGGRIPVWTPIGAGSATMTIAVRCRAGPVSRAPRYVGTGTPTSRNRTPARRLGLSTSRRTQFSYGVVSSPTSPPIQPPRVKNLLVRALRATPRGNKYQRNRGLWDAARLVAVGGGGFRRDATTKRGQLRGPGRALRRVGLDRIWPAVGLACRGAGRSRG